MNITLNAVLSVGFLNAIYLNDLVWSLGFSSQLVTWKQMLKILDQYFCARYSVS